MASQIAQEAKHIKNVKLNALAILERPPLADHFFDGIDSKKYKQRVVSLRNVIDCGERTQIGFPPSL